MNTIAPKITKAQIQHIADLASIPITDTEADSLKHAFEETLETIKELQSVDVSSVEPTHQVTGFENVLREDTVIESNMFTQAQALQNAQQTHKGYFVVPRIIDEK